MRLYPPAWISDRVALQDDAYNNFTFPKGSIIICFIMGYTEMQSIGTTLTPFMPERLQRRMKISAKPKAYYPFGGGPRLCIGNNFAMAEMAIFLQSMIEEFDIAPTDQQPKSNPLITLRPTASY